LRGQTMTPARLNMKPIKIVNRLAVAHHPRAHIAAFGFANRTAHPAREAIGQFFNAAAQIKRVPVKIRRPVRGELEGFAPAYFKVFPAALLREAKKSISYQTYHLPIEDKRFARIAKRKADAAAAGKRTAHFHQRNQRRQSAAARELKVKWLMAIRLVKYPCPGTGVKTTGIAVQSNNMVPSRLAKRTHNPHLQ